MPGICPRCLGEVYFAEEKLALGKVWHFFCFSCRNCRKLLDSCTVATHSGDLFCRNCYNRLFSTTSVRPTLPSPPRPILPTVDNSRFVDSPCESLFDCRCCCNCEKKCESDEANGREEPTIEDSSEKRRLRAGDGADGDTEEVLEVAGTFELGDNAICSKTDLSQLDLRSSQTNVCDQSANPTAVTAWYNRHHSASQSTFGRPSSAQQAPLRPSSTPASGEVVGVRDACNLSCSGNRRPGSPCRPNYRHREHSKKCHRQHCREFHRSDRVLDLHEESRIARDCRGRSFIQDYRKNLRSGSPGNRSGGGGGCLPSPTCQGPEDASPYDPCCQTKLPNGCECLGGGQDCQRCGRKVYQAEMQIASGVPYHNICFSCFCCRKPLETLTYHENCGEIYCKQCYVRNFGPQGYGYSGVLQTPM